MELEFWHQVWRDERIGFHAPEVNAFLRTEFARLDANPGEKILVPLCGMTHDLTWLAGRGLQVTGIEVSRVAVERYFRENGLDPEIVRMGEVERYSAGNVTIFRGDFFRIGPDEIGAISCYYDRAALIAMPPQMRPAYVDHLLSIVEPDSTGLVVTLEHDRGTGPPFSVGRGEVEELFSGVGGVQKIAERSRKGTASVAYLVGSVDDRAGKSGGEA